MTVAVTDFEREGGGDGSVAHDRMSGGRTRACRGCLARVNAGDPLNSLGQGELDWTMEPRIPNHVFS